MWLKGASSQGGGQCWGERGVTGKKASFVDETEHCFSPEKNDLEEILHIIFKHKIAHTFFSPTVEVFKH